MNDDVNEDVLDYGRLIDDAMHYVVRRALQIVQKHGLENEHHFYITFATNYPGVMISDELMKRYPEEMTIVLQYQYWDLEVEEDRFSLVLSFDNVKHSLLVPFAALVSFADPSVKFGLQFQYDVDADFEDEGELLLTSGEENAIPGDGKVQDAANNVVALDSFRKKK